MGCAASFNALAHEKINSNEVIAITSPTIQQQELMKYKQSTPNMSSGDRCEPNFKLYILVIIILICLVTINVLISCHHNEKDVAEQLSKQLTNLNFTCYTLTDATPSSIVARANLVRWSDVFISLISRSYQRTF
ncbi:unnamed protein product, partial [Rotaria magnacalcarata]